MKRIAVIVSLCALLVPSSAWAGAIDMVNQFGTVSVTSSGVVCTRSELIQFGTIVAPPGHALGSVSFSTGALSSGSIWSGGTFSATGSSFIVRGEGKYGEPKGVIFYAYFTGPIKWQLISHVGNYDYVFMLSGTVAGELFNGRMVYGTTQQTIVLYKNQWGLNQRGNLRGGVTKFGPEPGTLGLFASGAIALAGAMWRKRPQPSQK